jgi:enoyl-CoA hydratase
MTQTYELIQYDLQGNVATIRIDDGKRNALSPPLLREIYQALDQAENDRAIVILTGRESVFSAGFDLNVMKRGGINALRMLRAGYALTARVLAYPHPVIVACNGHSLALGVFLMLSADYVIGSRGDFKIAANEVAIGMPMPRVAAAVLRNRLSPSAYQRAVTLAEYFDVDAALSAGFFDELTEPADLRARAEACAVQYKGLDPQAHRVSKRRIRAALVRRIRVNIPLDLLDAVLVGWRRSRERHS